jgi:hypothetical protein
MKLLQQVQTQEKMKLIDFISESMNYANFWGKNLLMKYEVCSPQG